MIGRALGTAAVLAGSLLVLGSPAAPAAQEPQADREDEQQEQPPAEEPDREFEEAITVTGTRVAGRSALDTPAPVDYIDTAAISSTGATETGKVLQLLAPSFNFSATTISDGTDIIRPATLRALGPDQVLLLVNGKRRHQQSLLNVQQTIARGSAGYDINAIPISAIDHFEVLRDGAAAQYGSDAIAGVINVILEDHGGITNLRFEAGQHYAGDGEVLLGGASSGFTVRENGHLNVTLEYRDRGETNRSGPDLLRVDPPRVTQRIGDADAENRAVWINAGIPVGDGRFYAFGGWSNREGNSSGFFRSAEDGRTIPALYPDGFLPTIITEPTDTSMNLGYQGFFGADWTYDVGASFGSSEFEFREENTANVSYWFEPLDPNDPTGPIFAESPTSADTGTLELDQLLFTLDFAGLIERGGSEGLHVAAGAEWREDGYQISPGDPVSYQYGRRNDRSIPIFDQTGAIAQPGTQGFPGWSPAEAVDDDRSNVGVYVDLESQLSERFLGGVAVRFEDYSDFGSTVNGKLSGRVELSDQVSLRATASTGFRAPGVQQAFYSQRSTNLNAEGVLTDTLTARQGSDVALALGVPPLVEETSINYSVGVVARPGRRFRITADLYRIDIDDRIVFSSNIGLEDPGTCGSPFDPSLCPIRAILDPIGIGQLLLFTNAIDTETSGLDVVAVYDRDLAGGAHLSMEGALHFNDTDVVARRSASDVLPAEVLFDQPQITLIEEGQPGEHLVLGGTYGRGPWSANLRFNFFGEVAGEGFTPGFKQVWGSKWLTDLTVRYGFTENLEVSFGGLNIFDTFPDRWDPDLAAPFPQLGFIYGWETLPFGINGGYYFARLGYRIRH